MTRWWNKKWGKDKVCSITFSRLRPGVNQNGIRKCIFLQCGHGFYTTAITDWIKNSPKNTPECPNCRSPIDINDIENRIISFQHNI